MARASLANRLRAMRDRPGRFCPECGEYGNMGLVCRCGQFGIDRQDIWELCECVEIADEQAAEDATPEMPWCEPCQSFHHKDAPGCMADKDEEPCPDGCCVGEKEHDATGPVLPSSS